MLISFKIRNFRSFKDEVIFTLEADSSKLKSSNVAEIDLPNNNSIRLLKLAMIFGANASGKTNIIRAFYALISSIGVKQEVGEKVKMYEPFLFDKSSSNSNSLFEVDFIGPKNIRHNYRVLFNGNFIESEELNYYPQGREANLFTRVSSGIEDSKIDIGVLGTQFGKKEIKVFNNQLLLSKFGTDEPIEELTNIFLYFRKYEVINGANEDYRNLIEKRISQSFYSDEDLRNKLNSLVRFADTKIKEIRIIEAKDDNIKSSKNSPYLLSGLHSVYDNQRYTGEDRQLSFKEESTGTRVLFSMGGKVLLTLKNGGVLFIDELDVSLHPFLTRMLALMFQSEKHNPKHAQLVLTTHDMTLLDRDMVRRDQVWITEKREDGTSEIFSLQDFEGVREETPFDKWYLAGKFGGLPSIKSIDSMFDNGRTS
ncbi:MAG: ATP-binding protein [Chitinophagaceae bacterium]|nr:ATP-binding protein [Chitinophagaceae bacterium]